MIKSTFNCVQYFYSKYPIIGLKSIYTPIAYTYACKSHKSNREKLENCSFNYYLILISVVIISVVIISSCTILYCMAALTTTKITETFCQPNWYFMLFQFLLVSYIRKWNEQTHLWYRLAALLRINLKLILANSNKTLLECMIIRCKIQGIINSSFIASYRSR